VDDLNPEPLEAARFCNDAAQQVIKVVANLSWDTNANRDRNSPCGQGPGRKIWPVAQALCYCQDPLARTFVNPFPVVQRAVDGPKRNAGYLGDLPNSDFPHVLGTSRSATALRPPASKPPDFPFASSAL
jgi:hypothetical protein